MKVLVTGSEGSLMQAVIPLLLKKKYVVYGVDNLARYGARMGIAGNDYTFIKCDLTDGLSVQRLFDQIKPDYVIQAAATIYGVGGFNKYCGEMYKDITLHDNVLRAAANHNVLKVIYISSSMVYENCPQELAYPVCEDIVDTNPAPYTDYGLSKFVGERVSKAYLKQHGLKYTIWRPFNIITPYEKSESEEVGISHVFADYIKNIVIEKKHPLPILGDGFQVRCFTWIDEVAAAIADHSFSEKTDNEIYNLGNQEPISMRVLAEKIKDISVNEFKLFNDYFLLYDTIGDYENDVRVRIPNVDKAKEQLGWEAKMKVDDSVRMCLKYIVDGKHV
jgi:nucleoside-diphosphate-sugar epimerase